ncbi:MAG: hypothetical protein J6I60_04230 [Bacteroidaceae bacterium]|nr:hypothetical protein [Bacteroidaceae bacterium]
MKPSIILFTTLLSCLLLLPGVRSIAQVVQPDTAAVDTTGAGAGLLSAYGMQMNGGQLLNRIHSITPKFWKIYGINN